MSNEIAPKPYTPTPEEVVGESHEHCYGGTSLVLPGSITPTEAMSGQTILSHGYKFRRGHGNPFTPLPNLIYGTNAGVPCQWCHHCKMSVETRSEAHNKNAVYGMKQWCRRCGRVTASAVYYHVASPDEQPSQTMVKAQQWMNKPEAKG